MTPGAATLIVRHLEEQHARAQDRARAAAIEEQVAREAVAEARRRWGVR